MSAPANVIAFPRAFVPHLVDTPAPRPAPQLKPRWHVTPATVLACVVAGGLVGWCGFCFGLAFYGAKLALGVLS